MRAEVTAATRDGKRDDHAVPYAKRADVLADLHHLAHELVPEDVT